MAGTLAHAQIAAAATASVSNGTLTYTAAAGETNLVNVSLASGTFTVVDGGAPVVAGAGCSLPAAGRATCSASGVGSIRIDAGDGNDVITLLPSTPATLDDGPGDDLVSAGSGSDSFTGGAGHDIYYRNGGGEGGGRRGGGGGAGLFRGGGGPRGPPPPPP